MRPHMKSGLLAIAIGIMMLIVSVPSVMAETGAFHDAANLQCGKCHTMHASEGGTLPTMPGDSGAMTGPNTQLLFKDNVTDLCLVCHSNPTLAPDVFDAGIETPGGDFNYSGAVSNQAKGHNPGGTSSNESGSIKIDTTFSLTPPGGSALTRWTCVECHDEHGETSEAFMFRNLKKRGLTSGEFVAGDSEESDIWDGSTANLAQSSTNHNVYKTASTISSSAGFGKWCATCHGSFHGGAVTESNVGDNTNWIRHPTATALPSGYITNYGTTSSYLYPLETNNSNASTTAEWTLTQGSEAVTCLSCHKAHATNYANATRWDNAGASGNGTGCNKCHAKGA